MDSFLFALNAIAPIVLLMLLGYFLKRSGLFSESWFQLGNKMIFRLCLPCLLFINVYNIESFTDIDWSVVIYAECAIFFFAFVGFLLGKFAVADDRQKGVLMQSVFRSNYAIIGLSLASSLGNADALGIAAVLGAISLPTFNVLAIIALTVFRKDSHGNRAGIKTVLMESIKNPLIIGVFCGLAVLFIRSLLPVNEGAPIFTLKENLPFLFEAVNNVSKMCTPFALLILGGTFNFSAIKSMLRPILLGTAFRTVFVPVIAIGTAILLSKTALLHFDSSVYPAFLALFGSPSAVSCVSMAQEMDGDATLAGQLVVWTSVASIVSMFLFIVALRNMGLL